MSETRFLPQLDGASDWALNPLEDLSSRQLTRVFEKVRACMLDELHTSYYDAVEKYHLAQFTERWLAGSTLLLCARQAGQVYATLDYYTARLPLPGRVSALGSKQAAAFEGYYCQRSLDNLQANAVSLLRSMAITSLIPEEWFPRHKLEEMIENQIRDLGGFTHVEVDCQLNLAPGGLRWLAQATQAAMEGVQEKLAGGQPWPVRMLRSLKRLEANRQVIVYAGRQMKEGCLRLEIFEPGCVLDEHALQVESSESGVKVVEIAPPGQPLPVLGLLLDDYAPAPPPMECRPWWLRSPALQNLWWRLRRGLVRVE
jgi:hypothetical protein